MTSIPPEPQIEQGVSAIREGLIVGLPTDTVYGVGVDPFNDDAVARLFQLKGRPKHKPVGLLVSSMTQADACGVLRDDARDLAERHWPGALTLVVTPKVILADWVGDIQAKTVGIRVPDHPVALALLSAAGPLAVTSANRSGGPEAMSDVEARALLGDDVAVYLRGEAPGGVASTVVDATLPGLAILRQGPVHL